MDIEMRFIAYAVLIIGIAFGAGYSIGRVAGRLDESRDRLKKFMGGDS